MKLKSIDKYSKKELMQLILSNQVLLGLRLNEIHSFLLKKYGNEFNDEKHLDNTFKEFIDSFDELDRQIKRTIS